MQRETIRKYGSIIYYLIKGIILAGLIWAIINGEWREAFIITVILVVTFIPTILKEKYRFYLPIEFDISIDLFIFATLFLGEIHGYYEKFWWWDLALHGGSAFLLGMLGFILVYILNEHKKLRIDLAPGFVALFAFCFALAFGALWEIFEFFMDEVFGTNMLKSGIVDTMEDLIVDSIGAFVVSLFGYLWMKRRTKFFVFDKSIRQFVRKNRDWI